MKAPLFSRDSVIFPRVLFIVALFFLIHPPGALCANKKQALQTQGQRMRILREWKGSLPTVNKGLGKDRPPYIKVFRDSEGLLFQIQKFRKIRNRITHARVTKLSKELRQIDFSRDMVVGIFSLPMDNCSFSVKRVIRANDRITVNLAYRHKVRSYSILPNLKIYYRIIIVKKNDLPVLLKVGTPPPKKKRELAEKRLQTIDGTLKRWENVRDSIGLERRIKGKEHLYYIRDPRWIRELTPSLGKRIRVKGYILQAPGSIYEAEIKIREVIKISEAHHKKKRR